MVQSLEFSTVIPEEPGVTVLLLLAVLGGVNVDVGETTEDLSIGCLDHMECCSLVIDFIVVVRGLPAISVTTVKHLELFLLARSKERGKLMLLAFIKDL